MGFWLCAWANFLVVGGVSRIAGALVHVTALHYIGRNWCCKIKGTQMKRPRKRKPGAGRPPGEFGAKRATLSLRLPPHIRVALVAAAKKNRRRSVSEEILIRLNFTLARDRDEASRPRHIRALSEAVARIALGLEERTKRLWNEDRYTQQQLSKGIDWFLCNYSHGEAVIPPSVSAEAARKPEDTIFVDRFGETIASGMI